MDDMDLEKGEPPSSDSGGGGGAASLAGLGRRHPQCTCGSGGVNSCDRHYSFGLPNTSVGGMFLVTLLFVVLAAVLLPRRTHPAATPAADTDQQQQTVSVVWTASLLVCAYLAFWAYTFSRTMGAAAVFFRVSYAAMLACAAGAIAGPVAGMAAAHLATAWAAGLLGYALAEHRAHVGGGGGECAAADEAAARTPTTPAAGLSEGHRLAAIHAVFTVALLTLCLAALAVWLVFFFPSHGGGRDTHLVVVGLTAVTWMALYFWAFLVAGYLLREALVSMDSMMRFFYNMAFSALSTFGLVVSKWIWVYGLAVEMMAMAAFFGYMLAVNARCKEILAREGRKQPGLGDLFAGDNCDEATLEADVGGSHEEPASSSTAKDGLDVV